MTLHKNKHMKMTGVSNLHSNMIVVVTVLGIALNCQNMLDLTILTRLRYQPKKSTRGKRIFFDVKRYIKIDVIIIIINFR